MSIVAAIEQMLTNGLSIEQALVAAKAIEEQMTLKTARQKRNARYYLAHKQRLKTSELRRPDVRRFKTPNVLIKTPLARVEDNPSTEELSGKEEKNIGAGRLKPTPRTTLLECLSAESADAVMAHRRAMRRPLTVRAAQLLAKGFTATGDPNAAADMMIERGWQGFKPEWYDNERAGNGQGRRGREAERSIPEAGRRLTERLIAERQEREMRAGSRGDDGEPVVRFLPALGGQRP